MQECGYCSLALWISTKLVILSTVSFNNLGATGLGFIQTQRNKKIILTLLQCAAVPLSYNVQQTVSHPPLLL